MRIQDYINFKKVDLRYTKNAFKSNQFQIGDWSYGIPKVRFSNSGAKLRIGRFCSIADGVEIFLGGNHRIDWVTTYPFSEFSAWLKDARIDGHPSTKGDVSVGNDVWIGSKATILSGVTIGDGAVIGAGAIVSRDVPAYGIAVGNPAKIASLRFDPVTIDRLLNLAWWDMPIADLKSLLPYMLSSDIIAFLDRAEKLKQNKA